MSNEVQARMLGEVSFVLRTDHSGAKLGCECWEVDRLFTGLNNPTCEQMQVMKPCHAAAL